MTIKKSYIKTLENYFRCYIPDEAKKEILSLFSTEPEPYEWSDQDIWEQSRKIILKHKKPSSITIPV
jgi:hypothetical protein